MGSLGIAPTKSPISYQLQFNFKFRKCPSPLLFVRSRNGSRNCNHRMGYPSIVCVAQNGAKKESESESDSQRRRFGSSWGDTGLSNWGGEYVQEGGSGKNQGIAGMLGVGIASIFLVAGITFVATSIGKRSSSRPRIEMKPLTEQQETALTSGEEGHKEDDKNNDGTHSIENESAEETFAESSSVDSQHNFAASKTEENVVSSEPSSATDFPASVDAQPSEGANAKPDTTLAALNVANFDKGFAVSVSSKEEAELQKTIQGDGITSTVVQSSADKQDVVGKSDVITGASSALELQKTIQGDGITSTVVQSFGDKQVAVGKSDVITGESSALDSESSRNAFTSSGIPAPLLLSAALGVSPRKVLVPAIADQSQAQALAALQVVKVIESDAQPSELCTRRDYARWLVSASSALSRNPISKVYPAMYIENVTELAFDDVTPEDPDFAFIQGLAEAGLISSKLSRMDIRSSPEEDIGSILFYPNSPLSRQDLVTWKMALEKRQLPEADRKMIHQLSGFIDIDKINPDAWPALMADLSAGEQGIIAQAFGYTRLFQPDKPVTKGQAAVALATGEASEIVSEELARIEAESMAEKAVLTHNALVAEVEKDINATFERELMMEREKIETVQKMAEEAKKEVERLRREREEENVALMKERAAIESEMEVLNVMRLELEEQLESVMCSKVEMSSEKERIEKLRKETAEENLAVSRLQYQLEVELKALSMARAWAEDEAKRVQEHSKSLEEARDRWERQGIKVMVDEDLQKQASSEATLLIAKNHLSVEETVKRAENLTDKLKILASEVEGKSKEIINKIIEEVQLQISVLKEWISKAGKQTTELRDVAVAKVGDSVQELQKNAVGFGSTVRQNAIRVAGECREGIEKLTQKFKS